MLISHVHHDHLDKRSLRDVAGPEVAIVVPVGAAPLVEGLGFGTIHEVAAGDTLTLGGAEVRAVPAWHPSRRHPLAPEIPALGYVAGRDLVRRATPSSTTTWPRCAARSTSR